MEWALNVFPPPNTPQEPESKDEIPCMVHVRVDLLMTAHAHERELWWIESVLRTDRFKLVAASKAFVAMFERQEFPTDLVGVPGVSSSDARKLASRGLRTTAQLLGLFLLQFWRPSTVSSFPLAIALFELLLMHVGLDLWGVGFIAYTVARWCRERLRLPDDSNCLQLTRVSAHGPDLTTLSKPTDERFMTNVQHFGWLLLQGTVPENFQPWSLALLTRKC